MGKRLDLHTLGGVAPTLPLLSGGRGPAANSGRGPGGSLFTETSTRLNREVRFIGGVLALALSVLSLFDSDRLESRNEILTCSDSIAVSREKGEYVKGGSEQWPEQHRGFRDGVTPSPPVQGTRGAGSGNILSRGAVVL